jgi:LPXTG-motif cell wall-anchored protein
LEKETGLGLTLNFGHPVSWVIMIAVLVLAVVLLIRKRKRK